MTNKITKTTWRLLQERLDLVLDGQTPKKVEKREFYYICRKAFQDEWGLIEVDIKGADDGSRNPYKSWGDLVNKWALKQCDILEIEEGRFWEVMAKLNIWPHERGVCIKYDILKGTDEIVVKHSTKDRIMSDCSFILVSEKQSKVEDIWNALTEKGYVLNLISIGGHSTGTVQSIAAEVGDRLQQIGMGVMANFYILSLHDYDLDGITMLYTLRKWYKNVIDVGINRELLEHNKIDRDKKLYETVKIRKYPTNLMEWVPHQAEYSVEEIEDLLGPQTGFGKKPSWTGKRIELDTIYGTYGIEPMVNYIDDALRTKTSYWDLSNIGVDTQELDEGDNFFDDARNTFNTKVGKAYGEKGCELARTAERIRDIVNSNLKQEDNYWNLKVKYLDDTGEKAFLKYINEEKKTYWSYNVVDVKGVKEIYEKYPTDKDYISEFQKILDDEINDNLYWWEGDITTVKQDIEDRVEELQSDLDSEKTYDEDLENFIEELAKIEWGEEELKEVKQKDPVKETLRVIMALQKFVKELEAEK